MLTLLWNMFASKKRCRKLQRDKEEGWCIKCFDVGRILLIEILLYPLLICDLFSIFLGKGNEESTTDSTNEVRILSFKVLFGYSCVTRFFYAYFLRLIVLIYLVYDLHKRRKLKSITGISNSPSCLEEKISSSAIFLQSWFTVHIAGQMITQILMTAAIALKIKAESIDSTIDHISISGELWYMLFAGYILPLFGLLTFFIPTVELVYEYFIGFCMNLLSILGTPGIDTILFPTEALATPRQRVEEIALVLDKQKLETALLTIVDRDLQNKTSYSLQNIFCYLLCIGYSTLLVSFFVVSVINNAPIAFYVVYIFLCIAANFCPIGCQVSV